MKSLLLHVCCACCATIPIELLQDQFKIKLLWYNPNIYPKKEYKKRLKQVKKLKKIYKLSLIKAPYHSKDWLALTKGLEQEPEEGKRCDVCFQMRLQKTAEIGHKKGFDCFTTTLTAGPQKKAEKVNQIGEDLAKKYDIKFYSADFKKKDGFKKSLDLSKKYNFYRQNYCGCIYSLINKND